MKKSQIIHLAALSLLLSSFNDRCQAQSQKSSKGSPVKNEKKSDTASKRRNSGSSHIVPYYLMRNSATSADVVTTNSRSNSISARATKPSSNPVPKSVPVSRGGFGHSVSSAS